MSVLSVTFPVDVSTGTAAAFRRWQGAVTFTRDTAAQIVTVQLDVTRTEGTGTGGVYLEWPAGTIGPELLPEIAHYPYVDNVSWQILPGDGSGYAYIGGAGPISAGFRYVTGAPIVIDEPPAEPASSVLGGLRVELADDIAGTPADVTVYDHVPARAQLPAVFIVAGAPYVEQGDTFGSSIVRFGVVLLTQPSLSSDETDQLDERIEIVQRRLLSAGWLVERVERPEIQDLNGAEVLATALSVATAATFP